MKHTQTQKNKAIEQMFDSYAESLPSQEHLCDKAREQMSAGAVSASKKTTRRSWSLATVACCLVLLVVISFVSVISNLGKNDASPQASIYYSNNVSGKLIEGSQAKELLPVTELQNQYNVVFQRYVAYYFKNDGGFAYIQAILGVQTDYGIIEMGVIAENSEFVHESRIRQYNENIKGQRNAVVETFYAEKGEYVTAAFFNADNKNFYIVAQSNQSNTEISQNIVKIFQQTWDKSSI